ncbi:cysteine desulfurase family protein [Sphingomonas sp. ac-8]|uniref:cysteine desulfurase family protein n=1 Tax=Sphingomonas sp. ac-8 TaxID=3242977 RepID=UPI003A803205
MADRLYLDHAATTPMRPEAIAAVADGMARWANPSSPHAEGRAARRALEDARARIAGALGWRHEVILTSGASEAIALALRRAKGVRVAVAPTEHDAVLRAAGDAARLAVDAAGQVVLPDSGDARTLFAIQAVNSETGVLQPLDTLAAEIRACGDLLFADCAQSAGKLPLPDADLIAVSAHKLGGPPGVGALLVRDLGVLEPSGGQEQGYRGGTENLPGVLGFAAALEAPRDWLAEAAEWRALLDAAVLAEGGAVVAGTAPRISTIAAYRMPGVAAAAQLIRFDGGGIAVSAGSACSSGSLKPSHVLGAMGWDAQAAREVVRVSFGWTTRAEDVRRFVNAWAAIAREARSRAA